MTTSDLERLQSQHCLSKDISKALVFLTHLLGEVLLTFADQY
jgi:hypothetical protein